MGLFDSEPKEEKTTEKPVEKKVEETPAAPTPAPAAAPNKAALDRKWRQHCRQKGTAARPRPKGWGEKK